MAPCPEENAMAGVMKIAEGVRLALSADAERCSITPHEWLRRRWVYASAARANPVGAPP